jgi:capsule polysaccharide export protein KpsC/LpsZ
MVDLLSKCVPEGWSVYVREHPVQFKTIGSRGECSRTIDFYDDLASLSNVKLLPIPASNIDLIDHSEAVATVTGTGGWEALLREKPVLVFGYAWYKDCKGVFYTPTEETCRSALSKIQAGYKVDKKYIWLYLYVLEQVCIKAYLDFDYQKLAGISYEENVSVLKNIIHNFYTAITSKN